MKFSGATVVAFAAVASISSCIPATQAFTVGTTRTARASFVPTLKRTASSALSTRSNNNIISQMTMSSSAASSYTVAIVGATGAVGKEIRSCLEKSSFPVDKLRIFGSTRSAGRVVETDKFGDVTVELFSVDAARECDVVFLAVSGDFALEHAKAISDGDDGAVVIDNSVRTLLPAPLQKELPLYTCETRLSPFYFIHMYIYSLPFGTCQTFLW